MMRGWFDLSARGRIRVTGEDRVRLLHAMVTNDVQHLAPGSGCYAFFLNAQGRILADAIVLAFEDHLLLDVEPESRQFVYEHLDRYIIADDVALEDITGSTGEIEVLDPLPGEPYSHTRDGDRILVRASTTGLPAHRIIGKGTIPDLPEISPEEVRALRLANGVPRFPEDLADRLVQETQQLHGVHFNKGCYLGQEIVERVRARGGVHRFLVRLKSGRDLPPGAKLTFEGREVGEVTSMFRGFGLGYVRLPAGPTLDAGVEILEGGL